jgi:hypothetical protein
VRELIAPLGYDGRKTIVDDYLREVRPLFVPQRTFQRTVYRPGEICQFDLWELSGEIPVGYGQTRGWVVVACLGYSRVGAGALVFSKQTPELLAGIRRCLWLLVDASVRCWLRLSEVGGSAGSSALVARARPAPAMVAGRGGGVLAGGGRRQCDRVSHVPPMPVSKPKPE